MIAEHETVHLCEPFILAALGRAKGIKEVSLAVCELQDFDHCLPHLVVS